MPRTFTDPSEKRLYQCWADIKQRCYNPKLKKYPLYGGRGVRMCDEWRGSFQAFYEWAMKNGYSDDLTIERLNSGGDYCESNCIWSTYREQANNSSQNHIIEIAGVGRTISEWAAYFGVDYAKFKKKIYQVEREAL